MKEYQSPEFDVIQVFLKEDMLAATVSIETEIPDIGDDF